MLRLQRVRWRPLQVSPPCLLAKIDHPPFICAEYESRAGPAVGAEPCLTIILAYNWLLSSEKAIKRQVGRPRGALCSRPRARYALASTWPAPGRLLDLAVQYVRSMQQQGRNPALSLPTAVLLCRPDACAAFTCCHRCSWVQATRDAAVRLQPNKMQDAVPPWCGAHQTAPQQKATGGKSLGSALCGFHASRRQLGQEFCIVATPAA